ncbi:MAG: adenylyltransferase/cytidyltransferase family protein [Planctomycetes bacterium]|nr:adenylyltransferase/cytidyltransferase family protein [Planctomycetota bacterium]MBL7041285.1 adenylyltransferase/cytidyltransferase family protein [Pirellulaceae bacterium]
MDRVLISGSFDDLKSRHMRFLQEAARLGPVHVLLWSDESVQALEGQSPKFPQEERQYFVEAVRYVSRVTLVDGPIERNTLPTRYGSGPAIWVVQQSEDHADKRAFCEANGFQYRVIKDDHLKGFPEHPADESSTASSRKKVIVTGCYDWFHSGHVRFFEEVSELGELYVVVGHDDNIKLLKGEGHPMYSESERRYMAGSIRYVNQALVSTGNGWLDAEPEIEKIKPDIYAVNEDGDKPEKREYCEANGIDYRLLKRTPKEGLPKRQSTDLRGF